MAGDSGNVLAAAQATVRAGLSANAGYRAFQAGGGSIQRATWLRTVAEVRARASDYLEESGRPQNRRPTADEITQLSTKHQARFIQQVDVYVRDRDTGEIDVKSFSWRGQALITRKAAINEALAAFDTGITGSPDRFNETVLGATYTGTIQLVPRT
jgi:hypothetical protein